MRGRGRADGPGETEEEAARIARERHENGTLDEGEDWNCGDVEFIAEEDLVPRPAFMPISPSFDAKEAPRRFSAGIGAAARTDAGG